LRHIRIRLLICLAHTPIAFAADNLPPEIDISVTPQTVSGIPAVVDYELLGGDPDGTITNIYWSFGEGGHRLNVSGQYTYVSPGVFDVTVAAKDDQGAVSTASTTVTVSDLTYPTATFDSPVADPFTTDQDTIDVSGQTTGAVEVWWSTDRGEAGVATGVNNFTATVPLHGGRNRLLVNVYDGDGRMTSADCVVIYGPSDPLTIANIVPQTASAEKWEPFVVEFDVENTCATALEWPYETEVPSGIAPGLGITVNGEFSDDGYETALVQPAFYYQPYIYEERNSKDWLDPQEPARWMIRFAPPRTGAWQFRIVATDACGSAVSSVGSFTVVEPTDPDNHGFVRVNPDDTRYFRFDDGTHFTGVGHNDTYVDVKTFMKSMRRRHGLIGDDSANFFRIWTLGSCVAGSGHPPLLSATLPYRGYLPAEGLTAKQAYADGDVSVQLNSSNPCMFYGWLGGDTATELDHTYRIRVRVKLIEVTGPAREGYEYGFTVKRIGWPDPPDFFPNRSAIITHRTGSLDWVVLEGDYTAGGNYLGYLGLILENTTGGEAYIDEISIREVLDGDGLGPERNRRPRLNYHKYFCDMTSFQFDDLLERSRQQNLYYRIVVSERNDYVLTRLGSGGFMESSGSPENFNARLGTANYTYQTYWWRYLTARWGAYRSLHSWELANEQNPWDSRGYRHTQEMAAWFHANDPIRHDASTSFWSDFPDTGFWANPTYPDVVHCDVHQYMYYDTPENTDVAYGHWDLGRDLAPRVDKPIMRAETGILGPAAHGGGEDADLKLDIEGVWLHNYTWAQLDHNGMYELYWFPANIRGENVGHDDLYDVYRPFRQFMADIPLGNGHYVDAQATSTDSRIRVVGQFDPVNQRSHLWIQHADHTWRNVVDGVAISPTDTTVRVLGVLAHARYNVEWFDSYTGVWTIEEIVTGCEQSVLSLVVNGLTTDVAVKFALVELLAQADFDQDGDVDMSDFGVFQRCFSGPGVLQDDEDCACTRLDNDDDVDQDDFGVFQGCMSGPNVPADPDCRN